MPSQGGGGMGGQVPPSPPPSQKAVSAIRTFFAHFMILRVYTTMCAPSQSKTKLGNLDARGGGGGIYPQSQGLGAGVCASPPPPPPPPHYHPFRFLLPLQISCSPVVAKLICNSCAPYPPPTRLREIKKRALGWCRAGPMLLGWGE